MSTLAKVLIALGTVLLIVGLLWLRSCEDARTAKTATKLATGQAGAAIESGHDASGTIGNRMDADAAGDRLTQENRDAIKNAPGADAPVDPRLRDTALASLCRRAAYRSDPKCVQHAPAR